MLIRSLGVALVVALLGTVVITVGGGVLAGGFGLGDLFWVFSVCWAPIAVACVIIGVLGAKLEHTSAVMWIVAIVSAFVAVTLAGAIAAPIVQSIKYGVEKVNVVGYVTGGPVYGLCLLPVSGPLAFAAVKFLWSRSSNHSSKRVATGRPHPLTR